MNVTDEIVVDTRTSRQAHYLPTLDGWRAVAIGMVMMHHAAPSLTMALGARAEPMARFFYLYGEVGVHIFFALSGLLICTRLIQEHADTSRVSLGGFYIRRAYRILPPMLGFLAIAGMLGAVGIVTIKLKQWLSCLLLYANYRSGGNWTLGHFWTLSLEEHFYLTWPFLFAAWGPRKTLPATIAIAISMAVWRGYDMAYMLHPASWPTPMVRTDTAADGLLWGGVAALVLASAGGRRILGRVLGPVGFGGTLVCFLATFMIHPAGLWTNSVVMSFRAILLPLMLIATLLHPGSVVGRTLELRGMRFVGRLSYSLYLYQQIFLVWTGVGSPFLRPVQAFPLNFICSFACAIASYYRIERPFIRAGYRRSASWEAARPAGDLAYNDRAIERK